MINLSLKLLNSWQCA